MGTSFVRKVKDVRQMTVAQNEEGGGDIVEFQAQVSGHETNEKASRIQEFMWGAHLPTPWHCILGVCSIFVTCTATTQRTPRNLALSR